MKKRMLVVGGVALALLAVVLVRPGRADPKADDAAEHAFRDAIGGPPPGWTGPVFKLSRDYPKQKPAPCSTRDCPWLAIDPGFDVSFDTVPSPWERGPAKDYIAAILDYVRQGQDPNLANAVGFQVNVGGSTRWFHVPWMAYDPAVGRDWVHGTTNERTAHLGDLLGDGKGFGLHGLSRMRAECESRWAKGFETWSVGVYNEAGGWSIGQAFPADGRPSIGEWMGAKMPNGLPFPEGTVVVKFLTTNAPPDCVPYLRGSPEWQIDRHRRNPDTGEYSCEREVQISRLVQVDVAVVDPRSPTRWVYGTYAYNGHIDADNVWDRLVPVGLQWGSDPWTFPAVPKESSIPARQSVLNEGLNRDGVYQHFGCNGRLAGPVDNPQSSCVSCHASAFTAPNGAINQMGVNVPPSFGFDGICRQYSSENAAYFGSLISPQKYSAQYADALSLDTSLQLAVAFTQYGYYNTNGRPQPCQGPN